MAVEHACGFIIYRKLSEGIQYLLLQASNGVKHWSPPKGHVEADETDLQTAYRETLEETGITEDCLHVFDNMKVELNYIAFGNPKTTVYWLAQLKNVDIPVVISDEHQDYKWFCFADAFEAVNYPDMQDAMKKCEEFLEKHL